MAKNIIFETEVSQEIVDFLQEKEFRTAGKRVIVERMLEQGIVGDIFNKYHDDYLKEYQEFQLAFLSLWEYVPKEFTRGGENILNLRYTDNVLEVSRK